ncbi:MAG: DUF4345 domain-containing protein [Salibacteraceae bacterium]
MNAKKTIQISSNLFIGFSILSLSYVSVLSIYNPQATMDLVSTTLANNDAISSIRGIYGGVGLVIITTLVYLLIADTKKGLLFLALFWGSYAASRIITIVADGPLGEFGSNWLIIESTFSILAFGLFFLNKRYLSQ